MLPWSKHKDPDYKEYGLVVDAKCDCGATGVVGVRHPCPLKEGKRRYFTMPMQWTKPEGWVNTAPDDFEASGVIRTTSTGTGGYESSSSDEDIYQTRSGVKIPLHVKETQTQKNEPNSTVKDGHNDDGKGTDVDELVHIQSAPIEETKPTIASTTSSSSSGGNGSGNNDGSSSGNDSSYRNSSSSSSNVDGSSSDAVAAAVEGAGASLIPPPPPPTDVVGLSKEGAGVGVSEGSLAMATDAGRNETAKVAHTGAADGADSGRGTTNTSVGSSSSGAGGSSSSSGGSSGDARAAGSGIETDTTEKKRKSNDTGDGARGVYTLGRIKYQCTQSSLSPHEQSRFDQYMSVRDTDYAQMGKRVRVVKGAHAGRYGTVVSAVNPTTFLIGLTGREASKNTCLQLRTDEFQFIESAAGAPVHRGP